MVSNASRNLYSEFSFPDKCNRTQNHGIRGSVVVKALCYKQEGRGSIHDEVNF
jgi:hypothetical protein